MSKLRSLFGSVYRLVQRADFDAWSEKLKAIEVRSAMNERMIAATGLNRFISIPSHSKGNEYLNFVAQAFVEELPPEAG